VQSVKVGNGMFTPLNFTLMRHGSPLSTTTSTTRSTTTSNSRSTTTSTTRLIEIENEKHLSTLSFILPASDRDLGFQKRVIITLSGK